MSKSNWVLRLFNPNLETSLETDASSCAHMDGIQCSLPPEPLILLCVVIHRLREKPWV